MRELQRKIKKLIAPVVVLCLSLAMGAGMCGCVKKDVIAVEEEEKPQTEFTTRQIFTLIRSQQKKIEDAYTDEIFGIKMDDNGHIYADTFLGIMKDYIVKLYTMTDMANERGITLSTAEKERINEAAKDYVNKLNQKEDNIGISEEEVAELLTDIKLVKLLRQQITDNAGIEISESEARVADLQRIVLKTPEAADEVLRKVNDGGDFLSIARSQSADLEVEMKCAKQDLDPSYAEEVFALEDGEISPVINCGNMYYIFRCEKGYDEEATAQRKSKIQEERANQLLSDEYNRYAAEHPREIDENVWTMAMRLFSSTAVADSIFELIGE